MASVGLICLYDHRALGLRAIANALQAAGHEVTIIHFKPIALRSIETPLLR